MFFFSRDKMTIVRISFLKNDKNVFSSLKNIFGQKHFFDQKDKTNKEFGIETSPNTTATPMVE